MMIAESRLAVSAFAVAALFVVGCANADDVGAGGDATGSSGSTAASPTTRATEGDDADDDTPATGSATDGSATTSTTSTDTADTATESDDDSSADGNGEPGHFLLTVDDAASPPVLVRIDLASASTEIACELPASSTYDSLAFGRDGTLFGHNQAQNRLDTINPCNCGFQLVGPTSAGPLVLTRTARGDLYGIEPGLDAFLEVDVDTGLATVVGGLGLDFAGTAAAFSDTLTGVYAIDDTTDQLYTIDQRTGVATATVGLSVDVTSPGMAVSLDGTFWLCSGTTLYELDPLTGVATEAGELTLEGACDDLTAPEHFIGCLD